MKNTRVLSLKNLSKRFGTVVANNSVNIDLYRGEVLSLLGENGAGKTTLTKKIQQKYQNFKISVSHTTRKPRPNEVEGVDYNFVSQENFKKKISNNEFYEYAKIFDNYYGTSKETVDQMIKKNDIIFVCNTKNINILKNKFLGSSFVIQKKQNGTADAINSVKNIIPNNDILILFGDVPLISLQIINKLIK